MSLFKFVIGRLPFNDNRPRRVGCQRFFVVGIERGVGASALVTVNVVFVGVD